MRSLNSWLLFLLLIVLVVRLEEEKDGQFVILHNEGYERLVDEIGRVNGEFGFEVKRKLIPREDKKFPDGIPGGIPISFITPSNALRNFRGRVGGVAVLSSTELWQLVTSDAEIVGFNMLCNILVVSSDPQIQNIGQLQQANVKPTEIALGLKGTHEDIYHANAVLEAVGFQNLELVVNKWTFDRRVQALAEKKVRLMIATVCERPVQLSGLIESAKLHVVSIDENTVSKITADSENRFYLKTQVTFQINGQRKSYNTLAMPVVLLSSKGKLRDEEIKAMNNAIIGQSVKQDESVIRDFVTLLDWAHSTVEWANSKEFPHHDLLQTPLEVNELLAAIVAEHNP